MAPGGGLRPPSFSVTVDEACVDFGGEALFAGLSFTLAAGVWTCLLGPSGIGKTSLLRLILGLTGSDGTARVRCSDGQSLPDRAAYMAQRDLLLPWLAVADNVTLGPRLRGERVDEPARRRADAMLTAVGLDGLGEARLGTLSGGMRQRVALARTLFEDRPVVLMDEPFSAVDAITRVRLQDLSARLLGGRTVLLVTHDPLEALRLGHRIHVMSGRPAALDAPLTPATSPPRAVDDPHVLELQGELLRRLSAAGS